MSIFMEEGSKTLSLKDFEDIFRGITTGKIEQKVKILFTKSNREYTGFQNLIGIKIQKDTTLYLF